MNRRSGGRLVACVATLLAATAPSATAAAGDTRLGPGAEAVASRLGRALASRLEQTAPSVVVEQSRVTLSFPGPPPWSMAIEPADAGAGPATRHGRLRLISGAAPADLSDLATTLDAVVATLPWISPAPPLPDYRDLPRAASPDPLPPPALVALTEPGRNASAAQLRSALESYPRASSLWAAAAVATRRAGDTVSAAALADVAARLDPTPQERAALAEARGLDSPALPGTVWFLLGAALLWFALSTRLAGRRGALAVGVASAIAAAAALGTSQPAPTLVAPAAPAALHAALDGGACTVAPPLWSAQGWTVFARCLDAPARFDIAWSDGAPRTTALADEHSATVEAARLALHAAALTVTPPSALPMVHADSVANSHTLRPTRDRHALGAALALALAALLALLAVQLASWWHLVTVVFASRPLGRAALAVLAAAAVLIAILTPAHLVLVYTGYDLTGRLAGLGDLPRYGAGVAWLYRPALELLGAEVGSLQAANRLFGLLTLGPLLAATWAIARRPVPVAVAGVLFVGLPVFWRDHASEGMQAGVGFLLASGLAALLWSASAARSEPRRHLGLIAAVPILAFAATCRPEAVAAIALVFASCLVAARGSRIPVLVAGCTVALALVPHAAWLLHVVSGEVATTGIAPLQHAFGARVVDVLIDRNIFIADHWVPASLCIWAVIGVVRPGPSSRPLLLGLVVAATSWVLLSAVDLPRVSISRVHLPAVLLLLPLVGVGAAGLATGGRTRVVHIALAAAALAGAAWSLPDALAYTRNDTEERLIRAARSVIDETHAPCLATIGWDDLPAPGKTQRHFPLHRFADVPVFGLDRLLNRPESCGSGTVVLLGARCYMAMRRPDEPAPASEAPLSICSDVRTTLDMEPIVQWQMPNETEPGFPMYPAAPSLSVGLYRVR